MAAVNPFMGRRLSVLSKANIRYEGVLDSANPNNNTIKLLKVRSFGTETRPVPKFYPPVDAEFEYVVFSANDIENVSIIENAHGGLPDDLADPAVISHGDHMSADSMRAADGPPPHSSRAKAGGGRADGYMVPLQHVFVPNSDYDFEKANAKFEREVRGGEPDFAAMAGNVSIDEPEPKDKQAEEGDRECYNKSKSFFDSISTNEQLFAYKKQASEDAIVPKVKLHQANSAETFGEDALNEYYTEHMAKQARRRGPLPNYITSHPSYVDHTMHEQQHGRGHGSMHNNNNGHGSDLFVPPPDARSLTRLYSSYMNDVHSAHDHLIQAATQCNDGADKRA